MIGEYIQSNQGNTRDIYGNVRASAVDGRSPYVTSNYGTVDTLRLRDGRQVRVSAVDGDSPYIVTRNNPHYESDHARRNDGTGFLGPLFTLILGVPVAIIGGGIWGYRRGKSGK